MSYEPKSIRNVALLGHGNSGKTTLAESMLFVTGAVDRQGKITDGNTVCDYDAEEIKRQITISSAVAPVNFGGCKINVLDCPGYFDFAGEVAAAIRVVEAGIILCTAKDGISVGAERAWKTLRAAKVPVITSDLEGPIEVIDGGHYGIPFQCGNASDLAEKIMLFYDKEITIDTEAAWNFAHENFDINAATQKYLEAYEPLVHR